MKLHIEGVYRAWVGPILLAADKVIVLMTPLSVQEERICKRHEERVSGAAVSNKRETIESVRELIEWNRDYNLVKLPGLLRAVSIRIS